jgi:hypothetical protein
MIPSEIFFAPVRKNNLYDSLRKIFFAPIRKNNLYDKTREPTMNLSKEIYDFLAEPEGRREKGGVMCSYGGSLYYCG